MPNIALGGTLVPNQFEVAFESAIDKPRELEPETVLGSRGGLTRHAYRFAGP
jgi:hypothetical protein